MKNPTGKLEKSGVAATDVSNNENVDNIAENIGNINSYRMNFVTKQPSCFNVDKIIQSPKNMQSGNQSIEKKETCKLGINYYTNNCNNNNNHNNDDNRNNKSCSYSKEESDFQNMSVGSKEIQGLSLRPNENNIAKTKMSCMEFQQVLNGDDGFKIDSGIIEFENKANGDSKINFINDSQWNRTNNVCDELRNRSKELNDKNLDFKDYEWKINELQAKLVELQKQVKI